MFDFIYNILWRCKEKAEGMSSFYDGFYDAVEDEEVPKEPEKWMLTILDKNTNRAIRKTIIRGPLRIGRQKGNDILLNGRKQHRHELEIGMDEKGIFVNSLDHDNGTYAYGDGSYNVLAPRATLIPQDEKALKIIYGDLIYIIEKEKKNRELQSSKKGVIRNEEEITE